MSPYVDPATRPKRNLVIADIQLRSSISAAPRGGAKIVMRIVDSATGKTLGTRETTLGREDWAGPLEVIAKKISDDICKLSDVYEVTLDVNGEGRFATHSGRRHPPDAAHGEDPEGGGPAARSGDRPVRPGLDHVASGVLRGVDPGPRAHGASVRHDSA